MVDKLIFAQLIEHVCYGSKIKLNLSAWELSVEYRKILGNKYKSETRVRVKSDEEEVRKISAQTNMRKRNFLFAQPDANCLINWT